MHDPEGWCPGRSKPDRLSLAYNILQHSMRHVVTCCSMLRSSTATESLFPPASLRDRGSPTAAIMYAGLCRHVMIVIFCHIFLSRQVFRTLRACLAWSTVSLGTCAFMMVSKCSERTCHSLKSWSCRVPFGFFHLHAQTTLHMGYGYRWIW